MLNRQIKFSSGHNLYTHIHTNRDPYFIYLLHSHRMNSKLNGKFCETKMYGKIIEKLGHYKSWVLKVAKFFFLKQKTKTKNFISLK